MEENYNKSLNEFRKGFINLKDKTVIEVLEEAIKNSNEPLIKECYEEFLSLKDDKKKIIEESIWKSKSINKDIDLENLTYGIIRSDHSIHHPYSY